MKSKLDSLVMVINNDSDLGKRVIREAEENLLAKGHLQDEVDPAWEELHQMELDAEKEKAETEFYESQVKDRRGAVRFSL